jgi:hypothetical protein
MVLRFPRIARLAFVVAAGLLSLEAPAFAGVSVSTPVPGAKVSSPVRITASATSSTGYPISSMRVYIDGSQKASSSGSKLDASVALSTGWRKMIVRAWDSSGRSQDVAYSFYVTGTTTTSSGSTSTTTKKVYSDIEQMSGWDHCTVCAGTDAKGTVAQYSMTRGQSSPSMDGNSTKFWLGGSTPYSHALWWKQLGYNNNAKNFVYDVYFYIKEPHKSQALEFDVNQSTGSYRYSWATQCNIKDAGTWDIWDTKNYNWIHTSIPCKAPAAYKWHRLTWEFKRDGTKTIFVAFTYNGQKHYVNRSYYARPISSKDINVAFQADGDKYQQDYSTWLDNVKLTYW